MNKEQKIFELEREIEFWIKRAEEGGSLLSGGYCGASSNAMCRFMTGRDKEPYTHPYDDSDWGRCQRTIHTIPFIDWLEKVYELPKYKGWKPYEDRLIIAVTTRIDLLKKAPKNSNPE